MKISKTAFLFFSTALFFQSFAFASSYACITSSDVPNVAYCYENDFYTIEGIRTPSAPARLETIKGDNIMNYLKSDLEKSYQQWQNIKNSQVEEVNERGLDFNVSIDNNPVLVAPYIAPTYLNRMGQLTISGNGNLLFDGKAVSKLLYFYTKQD